MGEKDRISAIVETKEQSRIIIYHFLSVYDNIATQAKGCVQGPKFRRQGKNTKQNNRY